MDRLVLLVVLGVMGCCAASNEVGPTDEPAPPEPEPEPVLVPEPEPEPEPAPQPQPVACLQAIPNLPAALPDDARRCLEGLVAAREGFAFVPPPSPDATPCAVEDLDDDGSLLRRGNVPTDKPHAVVFDEPEDADLRTVMTRTVHRDAKGRETGHDKVWDEYRDGESTPDCSNTSSTRHTLDARGWPKKSREVIDSCEGVDAGTIVTKRRFRSHEGFVTATLAIMDRGTKLNGTAWWLPEPAAPLAFRQTDHYGESDCWLEVRGCDDVVLGRMHGRAGEVHGVERHVWACAPPR